MQQITYTVINLSKLTVSGRQCNTVASQGGQDVDIALQDASKDRTWVDFALPDTNKDTSSPPIYGVALLHCN